MNLQTFIFQLATLLKQRLRQMRFPVNSAEALKTFFFTEQLQANSSADLIEILGK